MEGSAISRDATHCRSWRDGLASGDSVLGDIYDATSANRRAFAATRTNQATRLSACMVKLTGHCLLP